MSITRFSKSSLVAVLLAVFMLASFSAGAANLNVAGGQLMGATGVIVDGSSYNVAFLDGTCIALYDGCDEASDFTFQTAAAATLASQALLDQVFLDGIGLFDSNPALTNVYAVWSIVPEPGTASLLGLGLAALAANGRRRRRSFLIG
ncbi:PEP-CTERM sorting domain-containing protein [Myxococcota bacterium]|nr:PEP-CTERM sorting domain-containing protein [Myxococcota bacterium]